MYMKRLTSYQIILNNLLLHCYILFSVSWWHYIAFKISRPYLRTELPCTIRQRAVIIYLPMFRDSLSVPPSRVKKPSQKWRSSTVFRNSWTFHKYTLPHPFLFFIHELYSNSNYSNIRSGRQQFGSKRCHLYTKLHGVTYRITVLMDSTETSARNQTVWTYFQSFLMGDSWEWRSINFKYRIAGPQSCAFRHTALLHPRDVHPYSCNKQTNYVWLPGNNRPVTHH